MKFTRNLISFLFAAMLLPVVSHAAYTPTDQSVGTMSVKTARRVLSDSLQQGHTNPAEVHIRWNTITSTIAGRTYIEAKKLDEIPAISASRLRVWVTGKEGKKQFLYDYSGSDTHVQLCADALYVLKRNAIRLKKEWSEFDSIFTSSLADFRTKAASTEALPEEARKYKVQAEGAVRAKEFDEAADLYAATLKIVPWWPAGHFNRALLLGESGDYDLARREMNYYLQLLPDAPDAQAAQDKIYEWERLESKIKS